MANESKNVLTVASAEKFLSRMATKEFTEDFNALLKSRYPLIYIVSNEEKRFLQYLKYLSKSRGYKIVLWDCVTGQTSINSDGESEEATSLSDLTDVDDVLDKIHEEANLAITAKKLESEDSRGIIHVLLDFHRYMDSQCPPDTERRIKMLSHLQSLTTVICTGPSYSTTPVLEDFFAVLDFPLPNEDELSCVLNDITHGVSTTIPSLKKNLKGREEELVKSVSGLTLFDAQSAFLKSIVQHKDYHIPTLLKEKKQIIRKRGVIEYFDTTITMDDVGGLENMVNWLKLRKSAFTDRAKDFGLQQPKGFLVVGYPGGGKSLVAKATASLYGIPLLKLDFGRLFGSLLGESEQQARDAIKLAEAVAPAVLWIDEVEKGISGGEGSGHTDGGVTSRVISTFLTWLQEKTSPVFVVCTANNHSAIPPEFMRAGRFDEVFFVDLPNATERVDIARILISRAKRDPEKFDLNLISGMSEGYSGAELEKGIFEAITQVFQDHDGEKDIETKDIVRALQTFKPLSVMREDEFQVIREWAEGNCRFANAKNKLELGASKKAELDLD